MCSVAAMRLHDARGKRLYLTAEERVAFLAAAAKAARPVRTPCGVLHTTGCRVSEALALTPERVDLAGEALVFETLKKLRRGVFRAVPVPPGLLRPARPGARGQEGAAARQGARRASPAAVVTDDGMAAGHRGDGGGRHPARPAPHAQGPPARLRGARDLERSAAEHAEQ